MLEIKNIVKSYKSNQVLSDVNFLVKKGEIKALIGENGAGKSTLIEIICGVKKSDSGQILINGVDISNKKQKHKIKRNIGYMPQSFSLYQDLTVEENLGYVCAVYGIDEKTQIDRVLKLCFLEDKKHFLTQNLSGGYRQLVSMACAIVHSPSLLILDEPTSAMDPIFRKRFWGIVKNINKSGTTVLLITHHVEEILECDSFACLSGGKIVFDGKTKQFKKEGFINIEEILNKFHKE